MSKWDGERRPAVYAAAKKAFDDVPECVRMDLFEALTWAKQTLTNHEGAGHSFELAYDTKTDGFIACFAKPRWNADHASQPMDTAQEAIVMAVCEYLSGV